MKNTIISILCIFMALSSWAEEKHLRERVYLSTDKNAYIAGDMLWLSAFCADVNTGRLSAFSKTAYVEIHSAGGMVQTGKIALKDGRGAGRIVLSNTLPTGNYSIVAYTAQSSNEAGYDYLADQKIISVFNTLSSERAEGGVNICETPAETVKEPQAGQLAIEAAQSTETDKYIPVKITNNGSEPVSFSVSVYHDDGIKATQGSRMGRFAKSVNSLKNTRAEFRKTRTAEYEGEIIYATVAGIDAESAKAMYGKHAFISAPGNMENLYTATIDAQGKVAFFTSNIYGDKDIFAEIEGIPEGVACHLEMVSPFVNVSVKDIPVLDMSRSYADALSQRSMGMQIEKAFESDTLYSLLPMRQHETFNGQCITYNLDDYTRFPVMSDVLTEYVKELRPRMTNKVRDIQVRLEDYVNSMSFSEGRSLMMIDGIPVLEQERILDYDPLLVNRIEIYPNTYFLGTRNFGGVANFVTYKGNLPSMKFADNVRILSYQGTSFPLAYTCSKVSSSYPDYRQTIYWHPVISLEPGESVEIQCKTPAYSGRFEISAEGLTDSLEAVTATSAFNVVK